LGKSGNASISFGLEIESYYPSFNRSRQLATRIDTTIEPHLLAASNQETGQKMERPEGRIQKVIKIQLFSGFLGSGTINLSFSFLISLSPADSTLGLLLATSAGTRQRV